MRGPKYPLVLALAATLASLALLGAAGSAAAYSIWPLAGSGTPCATPPSCGDGGAGTAALLGYPEGVAVGPAGDAFIADWGDNEVRKLSVTGSITPVAGGGVPCSSAPACGDGGAATDAQLSFPDGVAVDQAGNVYIADTGDNEIRKVSPAGRIIRFAGTGAACSKPPACGDGGSATAAQLRSPFGVAVDRAGNVYVADAGDNEIRKITPAGKISRIAGDGSSCAKPPSCGDGAAASAAQLNFPTGVALDASGSVYIADDGDNEIRKLSTGGTISRIAGDGTACASPPGCGDGGPAVDAKLGAPDGVAADAHGNVYIADDLDNEVRKVSSGGTISTIAGNGAACALAAACGNGGSATAAQLNYPDALALDPFGNVYVEDTYDQQLRLLTAARGSSVTTSSGTLSVLALAPVVSRSSVAVRYLLSGSAAISLSVTPAGGKPAIVARAAGRPGWGTLTWNRRLGAASAPKGRYRLTVTASVGARSAASGLTVRL